MTQRVGHVAKLPIDDVRLTDVEVVVKPMWVGLRCPPAAKRLVTRIARVIDHRVALENPNADPDATDWATTMLKRLKKRNGDAPHHTKKRPSLAYTKAPAIDGPRYRPMT